MKKLAVGLKIKIWSLKKFYTKSKSIFLPILDVTESEWEKKGMYTE
jgi:hypothetical protein